MGVIGIDVGGTNIKAGIVEENKIIRKISLLTKGNIGLDVSLNQIKSTILKLLLFALNKKIKIEGIGIGIAGIVDTKNGIVRYSPNLKGWQNIKLKEIIEEEFKIPVKILNDVNAILLGEWQYGAAKGYNNVFLLTLGTGVGGAAISEGKLVFGAHGFAGEIGHTTIKYDGKKCVCGNLGCLEEYVGTRGIIKLALKKRRKRESNLNKYTELTPKIIGNEANKGDVVAQEVLRETGWRLGIGISNIINLFDPEVVIISGGIAQAGTPLFQEIKKSLEKRVIGSNYREFKILASKLKDKAGIFGSAYFFKTSLSLPYEIPVKNLL